LFHTVTYIHELPISEEEKLFYVKRIRGQLSNHEIALFFINSCSIGESWKQFDSNNQNIDLITRYELIRNLPTGFFELIDHKSYFPQIKYEDDKAY